MRRIFDVHLHFPFNWEQPDADPAPLLADVAERALEAGVTRACVLSGGRWGPDHETSIRLLEGYPDLFIPVAMIDPEKVGSERVHELWDMGYRGLKLIGVERPYDCEDYWPAYAKAQDLGMPVLFHLGVIGGPIDFSRTHPRRDPEAARILKWWMERMEPRNVSADRMTPLHLDTLAWNFPRLKIIGAHLGNTGNYEYASSVARWRPNVLFDISGGETIEQHAVELGLIGKEIGIEKLVFGSDTRPERIIEHVGRWQAIFDQLELDDDAQERIWWRNGAELYGLEEPTLAAE
jgi:predicted TIM-barrel fold metal-dependent hydrolase